MSGVRILETTIRDGGYEISHQFTEEDVALVVSTLDAAGVSYIEIGYGMGVGAQKFPPGTRPKERPAADDHAHMRTGKAAKRNAKVGVLFGAGDIFCPPEYLDEVAAAGMDFVRLAFMPGDVTPANMRYVERARALGLIVSINCMQTYIVPPREIAKLAAMCRSAGAHWWYVVDSAGGMQPAETRAYVRAVREACDIEIGLHAHNNLGMAVANSLAAVEEGATLVDCTLNGLGRATGNAPTEQLVLALQGMGHEEGVDVEPLVRLSAMYRVLFEDKGNNPMHFVSGASMLHSRNVPAVLATAKERRLSAADFMVRVGREARAASCLDRFQFPPEVLERAAAASKPARSADASEVLEAAIAGRIAAQRGADFAGWCEQLAVRAARYHVPSVLHLVRDDQFAFAGPVPWQSGALVGLSLPWRGEAAEGEYRPPDYVLVDPAMPRSGLPRCRTAVLACAWNDVWLDAIRAAVAAALALGGRGVWIPASDDPSARTIAQRLGTAGFEVSAERGGGERAVVVVTHAGAADVVPRLVAGDIVVLTDRRHDGGRAVVDAIRSAGAQAIAPPVAATLAARAHELVALTAQLEPLLATAAPDAPWVPPLLAPGRAQAVVDVELGTIVEDGPHPHDELVTTVAAARARTLANGTGRP